ncbi:MAG: ABC transporter ATP-binding protein [Deltaproteobacteria bacterium]|nr:ABC transporter ATP-binding protein [Deltaproteobacteria bacterium]MBW1961396.1 ABC transporter ATP-binding protein [Deltaproteobacteria bacterium]MBW2151088.1 ABC transporter ATP-binding protein [Deltaproteobacteria bacterium]
MKLEVRNLYVAYQRDLFILKGMDVSVPEGKVVIVIGPNGSGKSTLLKSICGILNPQKGSILLDGKDITGIELEQIVLRGISYIPQERAVFPQMSITENLEMGCWSFRKDRIRVKSRIEQIFTRFPVLAERRDQLAGSLSGGLQRILDIAKALLSEPSLLLVDEPSVGLSPVIAQGIYSELRALKKEKRTIVLVDQDVRSAMEIADEVYVLELGRVKASGAKETFEKRLHTVVQDWLI